MSTEQQQQVYRRYEMAWLKPFTDQIPCWDQLYYTQRLLARNGRRFVLWTLDAKLQPQVLDTLRTGHLEVGPHGPSMTISSSTAAPITITVQPYPLVDGKVYLWLPGVFDARYAPVKYEGDALEREVTWRFCAKSISNPELPSQHRAGKVYFTELREFHKLWPSAGV